LEYLLREIFGITVKFWGVREKLKVQKETRNFGQSVSTEFEL